MTRGSEERRLPILKGNLHNYYLRDQVIPLRGHLHRILSVNDGIIFTEQTMTADKEEYFQSGEFILENLVKTDECVDFDVLDFNIYTADVSRMIYGYWSSTCEAALQKAGVMKFNSICDSYGKPLMVRDRNVQIMEVRMKKSCFTDEGERAVLLAGFMFRELFRTLFPENYMNLYAVTEYAPKERYWECLLGDSSAVSLEEKVPPHEISHAVIIVPLGNKESMVAFSELFALNLFVCKRLDDTDACQRILQAGVDVADLSAVLHKGLLHPLVLAEREDEHTQNKNDEGKRKPPVDEEEEDERAGDLYHGDKQIFRPVVRKLRDIEQI